jgi:hypothetical protein
VIRFAGKVDRRRPINGRAAHHVAAAAPTCPAALPGERRPCLSPRPPVSPAHSTGGSSRALLIRVRSGGGGFLASSIRRGSTGEEPFHGSA